MDFTKTNYELTFGLVNGKVCIISHKACDYVRSTNNSI